MNQRAVELYQQALQFAYTEIGKEQANTAYFQGAVAGKFAELIVRECANVAADQSAIRPEYRIRQHFGVEE